MPDLLGKRYKEFGQLAVGSEHVIDWEVIPARAHLKYQSYDIVIHSLEDVQPHHCMIYDLSCWYVPVFGADAAETVSTTADLKNLYDRMVPKVDSTAPTAAWTVSEADAEIGDDDDQLYFRPDRISLQTLTNPANPAKLYGRREWLGFAEEKAYRTGSSTNCRYMTRHKGFVSRGVPSNYPGYIIWVLTIPPQVADNAFEVASTFPADTDFISLDFLAPVWDPIQLSRSVGGSGMDEWRRWSTNMLIEQGTSGTVQMAQKKLEVRMKRQVAFARNMSMGGTVTPDA